MKNSRMMSPIRASLLRTQKNCKVDNLKISIESETFYCASVALLIAMIKSRGSAFKKKSYMRPLPITVGKFLKFIRRYEPVKYVIGSTVYKMYPNLVCSD